MKYKLAVCQNMVVTEKKSNLNKIEAMVAEASENGAKLVVLPEMFNCPYDADYFPKMAESFPSGETITFLQSLSKKHNTYIVGGSIPEKEGEVIYNTSFTVNPAGEVIGKHRKVHLFDVDIPGGIRFCESDTLGAGSSITVFDTELGKIGVAICYDVRFPEIIRLMVEQGAKIVVIPAAFNMTTGPAHWEALLKVRAVDNQAYVVGASPARDVNASYVAYGHSIVFDPWGEKLVEADEKEQIIYTEIDLNRVEEVRKNLPLLQHRRRDLYKLT